MNMRKLRVRRLDLPKESLTLSFEYGLNDAMETLDKDFGLKEEVVRFIVQSFKEIKDKAKNLYPQSVIEFVKSEDISKESAVNALWKISNSITELKKTKDAAKYMKMFYTVNSMQVELR